MNTTLAQINEVHSATARVEEHGQEWLICRNCGAQWSIEDSNLGEDYERVTEGDESCLNAEVRS